RLDPWSNRVKCLVTTGHGCRLPMAGSSICIPRQFRTPLPYVVHRVRVSTSTCFPNLALRQTEGILANAARFSFKRSVRGGHECGAWVPKTLLLRCCGRPSPDLPAMLGRQTFDAYRVKFL